MTELCWDCNDRRGARICPIYCEHKCHGVNHLDIRRQK